SCGAGSQTSAYRRGTPLRREGGRYNSPAPRWSVVPPSRPRRMNLPADPACVRRGVYALLIVVAVAGLAGRIIGLGRVYEPWLSRPPGKPERGAPRGLGPPPRPEPQPTHGDNARSRWDTVRALVEKHTYVIGHREGLAPDTGKPIDRGIAFED